MPPTACFFSSSSLAGSDPHTLPPRLPLHGSQPAQNFWIAPGGGVDADAASARNRADPLGTPFAAVFLSFPSAKDPTWAGRHPGKSTAHIVAEAPWELFETWAGERIKHRGAEYEALKTALAQKLLDAMLRLYPHLADRVAFTELGTPLSSAYYLGSARGESYGLAHTPARYRQEWLRPTTALPGLYLTGQDIVSAGVVGALIAGCLSAVAVAPLRVGAQNLGTLARM